MVFFPRKSYFLCFGDLRTVFLLDPSSSACASRERGGTVRLPGAPGQPRASWPGQSPPALNQAFPSEKTLHLLRCFQWGLAPAP